MNKHLEKWHQYVASKQHSKLDEILADDVCFHSPVVHTPQQGKAITAKYLIAADHVLNNEHFRYVNEISDKNLTVLEFETMLDGLYLNGVDMITWNDAGKIIDFKVMVRPLKAVNMIHAMMGKMLQANT